MLNFPLQKVCLCYFLRCLLICISCYMYPTLTLLVTKSSTYFFMICFSVLFQECSNHIWNCPLPTVDQKLSNSNQGQETQLEEYVYINDGPQLKLFIAKRELVSHLKTISEHLLIWISQFAQFDTNPSTSNYTWIEASVFKFWSHLKPL